MNFQFDHQIYLSIIKSPLLSLVMWNSFSARTDFYELTRDAFFSSGYLSYISSSLNSLKVQMAIIGHTIGDSIPAKFRYKERRERVRAEG